MNFIFIVRAPALQQVGLLAEGISRATELAQNSHQFTLVSQMWRHNDVIGRNDTYILHHSSV